MGHLINAEGIKLVPSYVQKLLDWPIPATGKKLSAFLGFAGYYQEFLPGYAHVTANLNEMKNKHRITWTEDMTNNFKTLKQMFASAPCRATPDFSPTAKPFIITIDFSQTAVGAVLPQQQNGVERFLGVKGRKCRPYESNYHSSKGELLALCYELQKYDHILRLSQFSVVTDSTTVLHWSTMKDTGGTIRHWLDFIQQFDFTVTHRSGKYNTNPDLISRATHLSEPPPSDVDSITQGKEDIFPLQWKKVSYRKKRKTPSYTSEKLWSQVKNCSSYPPPPRAKVKYVQ